MHEAAAHGEILRHYPAALWIMMNLITGLSYLVIGYILHTGWPIAKRYNSLFSAFITACGMHHVLHAIPVRSPLFHDLLAMLQVVAVIVMTSISAITMMLVVKEYRARRSSLV